MRLRAPFLLLPAMLALHTHLQAQYTPPPGYVSALTVSPPAISPDQPSTTITATVTPENGMPVSSLNGMIVDFESTGGGGDVPLNNGLASVVITAPVETSGITVFVTFPGAGQGGSTPAEAQVIYRYLPIPTALDGNWVFSVHSYSGLGTSSAGEGVSIGALTFNEDGDGNKTVTGELDYNGKLGSFQALPVTGNYTLDGYGRGTVTIQTSAGTQHFDLFASPSEFSFMSPLTQAVLVETDGPNIAGSGTLMARSEAGGVSPLYGYQIDLSGSLYGQTPFPLRASLTGNINVNSDFGSAPPPNPNAGLVDLVAGAYVQQGVPLTVKAISADAQNRYTFQFTTPNQIPQQPTNFVGYAVDAKHLFLMSTDPVPKAVLLSGQATTP